MSRSVARSGDVRGSHRVVLQAGGILRGNGLCEPGYVVIEDEWIVEVGGGPQSRPDLDFPEGTVVPGFVDLQVNGAAGCDFLSPTDDGLAAAHAYLVRTGTVAYLPTLISAPEDTLRKALAFFAGQMRRPGAPRILGVHLEGPFLAPSRAGAHRVEHLRLPDPAWMSGLLDDFPGLVRLVTLAPELDGAGEVIDVLVARGVLVAIGHSDATYGEATDAIGRGARLATHLFNAMRPWHHREPGPSGAALAHREVACSIIADLVHLHPAVIAQVAALKGWERTILVTDAVAAAGMPAAAVPDSAPGGAAPGSAGPTGGGPGWGGPGPPVTLGDRTVAVTGGAPRLPDGTLAGSVLSMDRAVRNVVAAGVPWVQAVAMASTTPARLLGLDQGEVRGGLRADLVVLADDLSVAAVLAGGRPVLAGGWGSRPDRGRGRPVRRGA